MSSIGIDWGSSSLRAYLFDDSHTLIDRKDSDRGITRLAESGQSFEQTLLDVVADWRQPHMRVLLSGMISSRNGWIETPYLPCPADLGDLYKKSVGHQLEDLNLHFLPGVCQTGDASDAMPDVMPDVMRGEELQLLAIGPGEGAELLVLPGTHSKWALVDSKSIRAFRTIPTGELFDVLLSSSLIGGLARGEGWSDEHFIDGVEFGYRRDAILGQLFTCRSGVLLERRTPTESRSYLSGLLIGREVREGLALHSADDRFVRLVGSESLCKHYHRAFAHVGIDCQVESRDAAALGYQQILQHH